MAKSPDQQKHPMESCTAKSTFFDGIKIAYYKSHGNGNGDTGEEEGEEGEALVFIHGWTANSSLWHLQAPLFQKYRSLLIDLPGHGDSDAPPDIEYTQELFAHAIEVVLSQEGIQKAVLIAHSMGGVVATMSLRLFPERISAIFYVDSMFRLPEHYLATTQRKEVALRHGDDAQFDALLGYLWAAKTSPETRVQVSEIMKATPHHVRVSAICTDHLPHAARWDEIFPIPARMISSPGFSVFGPIDQQWLHHIPQLKIEVWSDHGHFLFLEDPARFNAEVEKFLTEHGLLRKKQKGLRKS